MNKLMQQNRMVHTNEPHSVHKLIVVGLVRERNHRPEADDVDDPAQENLFMFTMRSLTLDSNLLSM